MRNVLKLGAAAMLIAGVTGCGPGQEPDRSSAGSAYILSEVAPVEDAAYDEYLEAVQPLIRKFGGRVMVRPSSGAEVVEGRPLEGQIALLEFPSRADRDRFWNSPEYRELKQIRLDNATSRIIMLSGPGAR